MRLPASALSPLLALPLLLGSHLVRAQDDEDDDAPVPITRSRIGGLDMARVRPEGALRALENKAALALELDGSREDWDDEPQVLERVQDWARRGGVVILHTDAAQLFGFKTIRVRATTRDKAGQQFGRARPALSFGVHPLLWNGLSASSEGATFGSVGVRVVFYHTARGDCFAAAHADGVPILRVTDLAQPEVDGSGHRAPERSDFRNTHAAVTILQQMGMPLREVACAAAIAPYGRGWALMLPRHIEAQRADGKAFSANIERLIRDLAARKVVGVPSAPIERAHDRWMRGRRVDWARVAGEMRRGVQDEEVEASEQDVAREMGLDSDQALSREQVSAHFDLVRKAARDAGEAEFFFEIAASAESAKRRRLLFLAQSRFRLLISQAELNRTLKAFDTAAAEQAANNLRAQKLPVEENRGDEEDADASEDAHPQDDATPEDAGQPEAPAPQVKPQAPVSEDERQFLSYRVAAGRMFLARTQAQAVGSASFAPNVMDWAPRARRLALEPCDFWLWRGIMAAGEADSARINSWIRATTLGDAAACWMRAMATSRGREVLDEGEDLPTPSPREMFGSDVDTSLREKALAVEKKQQDEAKADLQAGGASQVLVAGGAGAAGGASRGGDDIGSVETRDLQKWIAGAMAAREVLRRDAPVGGAISTSRLGSIHGWPALLGSLYGYGSSLGVGIGGGLEIQDYRLGSPIPRRGWFDDSRYGVPLRGILLTSDAQGRTMAGRGGSASASSFAAHLDKDGSLEWSGSWPWSNYSDHIRPALIAQTSVTLAAHSNFCAFGWRADAEDITLCPGVTSMRSLAGGILGTLRGRGRLLGPARTASLTVLGETTFTTSWKSSTSTSTNTTRCASWSASRSRALGPRCRLAWPWQACATSRAPTQGWWWARAS